MHPFLWFPNLSPLDWLPGQWGGGGGYRLFIRLRTSFQRSKSGVQSVYKVSKPTCIELSAWVKPLYMVSEPTSWGLSAWSAAWLYLFGTYNQGKVCWYAYCFTVFKPSSMELSVGGYRLFIKLRTYYQGTARVGCSLFIRFLNLPAGNCLPGLSLFIFFLKLPTMDCRQGVQPDCTCSEPTPRGQSAGMHPVLQFPKLPPWNFWPGVIDYL